MILTAQIMKSNAAVDFSATPSGSFRGSKTVVAIAARSYHRLICYDPFGITGEARGIAAINLEPTNRFFKKYFNKKAQKRC
jgi:hypothetical protein